MKNYRQTLLYGLSTLVMKGISLFMMPFITRHMALAEYGQLEVLLTLANLGSIVVGFGLADALYRFAGSHTDRDQQALVAADVLSLALLIGLATALLGWFMAPYISQRLPGSAPVEGVRLIMMTLAMEGCIAIPLAWLRMREHALTYFVLCVGKTVLQAGLVLLFLFQGMGINGILLAGFIAAAVLTAWLLLAQFKDTGMHWDWQRLKPLLHYGWPLVVSGLATFVLVGLDGWILAGAIGLEAMAHYAIAAKFALISALLVQPYGMWWFARRFQVLNHYAQGAQQAAYYAVIGCTLALISAVMLGLAAPVVIDLILAPMYHDAGFWVPWMVLVTVLKGWSELINLGCFTRQHSYYPMMIALIVAGVGLAGYLMLIPLLGIAGAILSLALAQGLRFVLYWRISQHYLKLPYAWRPLLLFSAFALALLLLGSQLHAVAVKIPFVMLAGVLMLAVGIRSHLLPYPSCMPRYRPLLGSHG